MLSEGCSFRVSNFWNSGGIMALEELESRAKALEDIDEIKDLHRMYAFYHVTKETLEEMIDCFAQDAIADIGIYGPKFGRDEIAALFHQVLSETKVSPDIPDGGECLTQPVIDVNGDKATGHWILDKFWDDVGAPGGPFLKTIRGRYDCEYVRENGRWKFRYLKWTMPWPETDRK
jgi:hypothetical protein